MKLYIIRHGETDWNKEKKLQGQCNTSLNEYGRELAIITGEALRDVHFDYAFSSPLNRALETAHLIMGPDRGIEIKTDDRLKEISFGEYEGVPAEEMPEDFHYFFDRPEEYKAPKGGETYEELCARTADFLEKVIKPLSLSDPDATAVIFGHGAMNKSILVNLQGLEIKDMWSGTFQHNCCVNIFEINGDSAELVQDAKIYY